MNVLTSSHILLFNLFLLTPWSAVTQNGDVSWFDKKTWDHFWEMVSQNSIAFWNVNLQFAFN